MGIEEFENRIICGDCVSVMEKMPSGCVDLVVCSPPYDSQRSYMGYTYDAECVITALRRVVKPGGVVVWNIQDQTVDGGKTGTSFRNALYFMSLGFKLYQNIHYVKSGTNFPSKVRYTEVTENMFVFSLLGKPKTINIIKDVPKLWQGSWATTRNRKKDGSLKDSKSKNCGAGRSGRAVGDEYGYKARTDLWQIANSHGFAHSDDLGATHPGSFPEALPRDHVISWSNPGDLVLDPLNGGGTTTKMAKQLGRRFIGIDCSAEYCAIAEKRLALVKEESDDRKEEK